MLEQLFNLVKDHSGETVINNQAVPNEQNGAVMAEATISIMGGLQNALAGGGLQSVLGMFGSGGANNAAAASSGIGGNPLVSMITGHFMNKLMSKFGLNNSAASGIAASLIPSVIGSLVNKTNSTENNGFNLAGVLGGLMGGATVAPTTNGATAGGFDLGGLLGKVMQGGMDQNKDGQTNLADLMTLVTGGSQQAQQQQAQSGGSILDSLKSLMG